MIKQWLTDLFNLQRLQVLIENDHVIGIDSKRRFSVPLTEIESILEVNYENPGAFDIDEFCILLLKDRFFLIGVGTEFAASVYINQIKAIRPSLNIIPVWFEHIPWRLRDRGCLGLRLFDLAGMGIFPLHYLPNYTLRKDSQIAIEAAIVKGQNNVQK